MTTLTEAADDRQLDWLLADFVRETPGRHARPRRLRPTGCASPPPPASTEALGDQLSAAASGLVSLAKGAARLLSAGPVTQTILEMAGGYLFVTAIDQGADARRARRPELRHRAWSATR